MNALPKSSITTMTRGKGETSWRKSLYKPRRKWPSWWICGPSSLACQLSMKLYVMTC